MDVLQRDPNNPSAKQNLKYVEYKLAQQIAPDNNQDAEAGKKRNEKPTKPKSVKRTHPAPDPMNSKPATDTTLPLQVLRTNSDYDSKTQHPRKERSDGKKLNKSK